jgi:hypothetical protein
MELKICQDHTWSQFLIWTNGNRTPHIIKCIGHDQFDLAGMMKYCLDYGFTMDEITNNLYQANDTKVSEPEWEYISDHPLEWRTRDA